MIGGFNFKLESKRLHYSFVLNRKITKIAGDSATGKSTLVSGVADSLNPRNKIQITCKYQCSEISEVFTSILFHKFARQESLLSCTKFANDKIL